MDIFEQLSVQVQVCRYTLITTEWAEVPFHTDFFSRLYLVTEGESRIAFPEGEVPMRPGCIYLIPSGRPFHLYSAPGLGHYWLHFTATIGENFGLMSSLNLPVERKTEGQSTIDLFHRLTEIFTAKSLAETAEKQA